MNDIPNKDKIIINRLVFPLIGISLKDLDYKIFNRGYLSEDGLFVFLKFYFEPTVVYSTHFYSDFKRDEDFYQIYETPKIFINDVNLMLKGKFSKISNKAKQIIINNSGLKYMEKNPKTNNVITSPVLLALSKHESLRLYLEKTMGVDIDVSSELLDKPTKGIFIKKFKEKI